MRDYYHIIEFKRSDAEVRTVLVEDIALKQSMLGIGDFVPEGSRDVKKVGEVRISGDTHHLGEVYSETCN